MLTEITKPKPGFQCQTCGHERLLNTRLERRIAQVAQTERRATVLHIVENLNQGATANVTERAVCRTLHCIGYGNQRPVRRPLLMALKKNRSLQFTREHKD
ncbi:hypothetical protein TNCV_3631771 [Trichonephila clavipes]|nr:hypothetical protein TNCV_3631771 [Trichonephila clavipes]